MAEMNLPTKSGKRKVHSTRIDFTPMVDLGFILITFFIYTTTIAKQAKLEINMPDNSTHQKAAYNEESTVTIMPFKDHKFAYYSGTLVSPDQVIFKSMDSMKNMLVVWKRKVAELPLSLSAQAHQLHIIIKPHEWCKYEDVVHTFDNLVLAKVPYYVLLDISVTESDIMNAKLK